MHHRDRTVDRELVGPSHVAARHRQSAGAGNGLVKQRKRIADLQRRALVGDGNGAGAEVGDVAGDRHIITRRTGTVHAEPAVAVNREVAADVEGAHAAGVTAADGGVGLDEDIAGDGAGAGQHTQAGDRRGTVVGGDPRISIHPVEVQVAHAGFDEAAAGAIIADHTGNRYRRIGIVDLEGAVGDQAVIAI